MKTIELKFAVSHPGVYNLNRFRVLITNSEMSSDTQSHFLNEIKINDDILFHVIDTSSQKKPVDGFDLPKDDLLNEYVLE